MPEENENESKHGDSRNAFSSPQERTNNNQITDFVERSTKKQSLSECLLLGPQNLEKIFDNRHIINNSETLFITTGYFNRQIRPQNNKIETLLETKIQKRTFDDILADLNKEHGNGSNYNEEYVINLLNELYEYMESENLINSKINSKTKIQILKCLYKFVESKNDKLLICIAKIILAVRNTKKKIQNITLNNFM